MAKPALKNDIALAKNSLIAYLIYNQEDPGGVQVKSLQEY